MRLLFLFIIIISGASLTWMIAAQGSMGVANRFASLWQAHHEWPSGSFASNAENGSGNRTSERLLAIEPYEDLDYGFKLAIPTGWRKIVTAESVSEPASTTMASAASEQESVSAPMPLSLEPGYAVGFESVQQNTNDRFADYILIEVLPGDESGRFDADQSLRHPVTIDGRETWFDRLEIDQMSSGMIDVDLVVYQAELSGVGYTVGLYAIGEPVREQLLAMAFEVMLQTFEMIRDPFSVS